MLKNRTINILIIEDEEYDVRRIRNTIKPFKKQIHVKDVISNGHAALELLKEKKKRYDVVIMDFQIAGGLMGENLIRKIKEIDNTIQIIVVTKMTINITDFEFANRLLEAGAMWYCTKYPGDIEDYIYQPTDFILSIFNAYEQKRLEVAKQQSEKKLNQSIQQILHKNQIIGETQTIQMLQQQILQCSNTDTNILISGNSGTGKELVATHIHYKSKRKFEKFIPINCGSLPQELIESELFGFEKGAFTGADKRKLGLFESANKGTIFLDEIGELPLSAQVKLLRVIQQGEVDKIGRTEKIKVDVRIIAATNKNLGQLVQQKNFREDLYYRLNVVTLNVPPLVERQDDILLLANHFMHLYSTDMSIETPVIEKDAGEIMKQYQWPGNVRELQNVVQRLLFTGEKKINASHIKNALGTDLSVTKDHFTLESMQQEQILPWRRMEKILRKKYFTFVRENTNSDAEAARKLGLAPPNYYRMCKELGLK